MGSRERRVCSSVKVPFHSASASRSVLFLRPQVGDSVGGTTVWSSLLPLPGRDGQGPLSRLPITTFSWPHHFRVYSGPFPYALNVKKVGEKSEGGAPIAGPAGPGKPLTPCSQQWLLPLPFISGSQPSSLGPRPLRLLGLPERHLLIYFRGFPWINIAKG